MLLHRDLVVLTQEDHPVTYASRALTQAEQRFQSFGVGVGVPFDLVGIAYGMTRGSPRDFVYDVGFEKVKVQLALCARVEGESADLTPYTPLSLLWFCTRNSRDRWQQTRRCGPRVSIR